MENINWLQEVEKRQDALLEDLFRLLRIRSVREDDKATEEAPVGPGPKAALEEFMKMAQEDGFQTKQFGPWAGHIEIGEGSELMGILGHVDVVPEGTGWDRDPYTPEIIDGRIYARGASDDKGPTVGAYFAIKLLRELGVTFNKKIRIIIGTDEESGWQCMDHYFANAEMPDFGFSPDAHFPIINGEKGNVSAIFKIEAGDKQEGAMKLVSFNAGLRANMVPQDAEAVIQTNDMEAIKEAFNKYIADNQLKGEFSVADQSVKLTMVGKSAHGSTPEKGVNAGTHLANFLSAYTFDRQGASNFISFVANSLHEDFIGEKLGVAVTDEVMGALSMNVGILNYSSQEGGEINANFRYPRNTDATKMEAAIAEHIPAEGIAFSMPNPSTPHYVSPEDPLVKTLLEVYNRQTGLEAHEKTIGGGTYGSLMERGVAYGALFPDSIDTMHQANEFLALEDLLRATAIYAEAIYLLTR